MPNHLTLTAITTDGSVYENDDVNALKDLPLDRVCYVQVATGDSRYPTVRFGCDPAKGERLKAFVSRNGKVLVLEILRRDLSSAKLYLHPELGPILTTEDLEL